MTLSDTQRIDAAAESIATLASWATEIHPNAWRVDLASTAELLKTRRGGGITRVLYQLECAEDAFYNGDISVGDHVEIFGEVLFDVVVDLVAIGAGR